MEAKTFALLIALLIFFAVIDLIRRQKMTFKYSLFWISASFTMLLLTIYDKVLAALSEAAGFELTSNFVFFLFCVFFGLLGVFLTVYINEQNSRTEALAQALGIVRMRVAELQKKLDDKNGAN